MLVQYLVGLCALKWDANAVDVTVGAKVKDEAAEKARDVDITVTVDTPEGLYAFKGYEVKHEGSPLDVADVEGLTLKLNDMPSVTHRGIVSTSGFTDSAIKKAEAHGVDLYEIKEWTKPLEEQFPHLAPMAGAPAETIRSIRYLLVWLFPPTGFWMGADAPEFTITNEDPLFDSGGQKHALYRDSKSFSEAMVLRSTGLLWRLEPARSLVAPLIEEIRSGATETREVEWPHTHTLDVASDEVYVRVEEQLHRVDTFTIYGSLKWEHRPMLYLVMEKVSTGEAFAGALIAVSDAPGQMWAFILSGQDRTYDVRQVQLARKHLNQITRLKLPLPDGDSSNG